MFCWGCDVSLLTIFLEFVSNKGPILVSSENLHLCSYCFLFEDNTHTHCIFVRSSRMRPWPLPSDSFTKNQDIHKFSFCVVEVWMMLWALYHIIGVGVCPIFGSGGGSLVFKRATAGNKIKVWNCEMARLFLLLRLGLNLSLTFCEVFLSAVLTGAKGPRWLWAYKLPAKNGTALVCLGFHCYMADLVFFSVHISKYGIYCFYELPDPNIRCCNSIGILYSITNTIMFEN